MSFENILIQKFKYSYTDDPDFYKILVEISVRKDLFYI